MFVLIPTTTDSWFNLICCRMQGKDVHDRDEFVYNKEFRHRMCRIKINQVQLKETVSIITVAVCGHQCQALCNKILRWLYFAPNIYFSQLTARGEHSYQ